MAGLNPNPTPNPNTDWNPAEFQRSSWQKNMRLTVFNNGINRPSAEGRADDNQSHQYMGIMVKPPCPFVRLIRRWKCQFFCIFVDKQASVPPPRQVLSLKKGSRSVLESVLLSTYLSHEEVVALPWLPSRIIYRLGKFVMHMLLLDRPGMIAWIRPPLNCTVTKHMVYLQSHFLFALKARTWFWKSLNAQSFRKLQSL